MDRRAFICGVVVFGTIAVARADAQRAAHARVGVFFSGSPDTAFERTWGQTFVSAMRSLGWMEDHNLTLEWRYSEDREDRRQAIVEEFVKLKVDVIVIQSTPESLVAKRLTKTMVTR